MCRERECVNNIGVVPSYQLLFTKTLKYGILLIMEGKRIPNPEEYKAIAVMKSYGLDPVTAPLKRSWDVVCGGVNVELKSASFSNNHWVFNIHRHGTVSEEGVHFYVFRLEVIPSLMLGKSAIHLVIPAPLEVTTITITPRLLLTKYAVHFNRFDLIKDFPNGVLLYRRTHAKLVQRTPKMKVEEEEKEETRHTDTKQLKLDIPSTLHRRFKLTATERNVTMQSVVVELLERWTGQAQDGRRRGVASPRPDIST